MDCSVGSDARRSAFTVFVGAAIGRPWYGVGNCGNLWGLHIIRSVATGERFLTKLGMTEWGGNDSSVRNDRVTGMARWPEWQGRVIDF